MTTQPSSSSETESPTDSTSPEPTLQPSPSLRSNVVFNSVFTREDALDQLKDEAWYCLSLDCTFGDNRSKLDDLVCMAVGFLVILHLLLSLSNIPNS